jgi:hypothetical protein
MEEEEGADQVIFLVVFLALLLLIFIVEGIRQQKAGRCSRQLGSSEMRRRGMRGERKHR